MLALRSSLAALLPLALTSLACGGSPPEAAAPSAVAAPKAGPAADVRFVDVTEAAGVRFRHNTGAFGERWLPETIGPGVVLFDADGDRRLDVLFVNSSAFPGKPGAKTPPALYRNLGGLRFEDATAAAGLTFTPYCMGGAAADIDNDGDADLFLACVGRDYLLENQGGRFTDVSQKAGLATDYAFGIGALFFDADRDGWLDLYVTRYVTWTPAQDVFCSLDGKSKSYCTPSLYPGASPVYYRNRGDGTFEDRTRAAGLYVPEAKTMGAVALDLDQDGATDLAVAGDTYPNLLYHNRGDGTFDEIAAEAGIAYGETGRARGGMGIDAGDYERTGRQGLAITYFANEMVGLYRNLGQKVFMDVAPASEVGRNTLLMLSWASFFFDYDLDGWLDLFIANGHLDEQIENVQAQVKYAQPQQLFRNQGEGRFTDVSASAGGDLAKPLVARGGAYGDLDGDGDLDLVLATNGGPGKIYENRGSGHGAWLRVHLRGTKSNRDGLDATVTVTAGGARQTAFVRAGSSYISQCQIDPTFGLGTATKADEVTVRWPSGVTQTVKDVAAGQVLELVEPAG
jgi:enediyne biosynthesis protein E4